MPRNLKRYYGFGHLHFITFSCYQRLPLLGSRRRRDLLLRALEATRLKYEMIVVGYVVMPEHVHLLVGEPGRRDLSVAIKALKQGVARRVLRQLRRATGQSALFGNLAPRRFWQARFYDFNVWSAKKRTEKLRYMHRNPVKRGLVASPELWRWSSFRHYAYGEAGPVAVNAARISHTSKRRRVARPTIAYRSHSRGCPTRAGFARVGRLFEVPRSGKRS